MQNFVRQTSDPAPEIAVLGDTPALIVRIMVPLTGAHVATVRTEILSALESRKEPQRLVLDLGEVRHIEPSGIAMLVEISSKAKAEGLPCVVANMRARLRGVFETTPVIKLFTPAGAIDLALDAHFRPRAPAGILMPERTPILTGRRARREISETDGHAAGATREIKWKEDWNRRRDALQERLQTADSQLASLKEEMARLNGERRDEPSASEWSRSNQEVSEREVDG
jgi:anti-anti-sigma factor